MQPVIQGKIKLLGCVAIAAKIIYNKKYQT